MQSGKTAIVRTRATPCPMWLRGECNKPSHYRCCRERNLSRKQRTQCFSSVFVSCIFLILICLSPCKITGARDINSVKPALKVTKELMSSSEQAVSLAYDPRIGGDRGYRIPDCEECRASEHKRLVVQVRECSSHNKYVM